MGRRPVRPCPLPQRARAGCETAWAHCESSGASPTGPRCPLLAPQVPRGHRALQMERRPTKLKATGNTPGQSWPLRKRQQQTCKLLTCKLLTCKLLSLESAPRLRRVPRPLLASHLAWRRARAAWRRMEPIRLYQPAAAASAAPIRTLSFTRESDAAQQSSPVSPVNATPSRTPFFLTVSVPASQSSSSPTTSPAPKPSCPSHSA